MSYDPYALYENLRRGYGTEDDILALQDKTCVDAVLAVGGGDLVKIKNIMVSLALNDETSMDRSDIIFQALAQMVSNNEGFAEVVGRSEPLWKFMWDLLEVDEGESRLRFPSDSSLFWKASQFFGSLVLRSKYFAGICGAHEALREQLCDVIFRPNRGPALREKWDEWGERERERGKEGERERR